MNYKMEIKNEKIILILGLGIIVVGIILAIIFNIPIRIS